VNPAGGRERQVAPNLAHNPEAKGRGLGEKDQQERDQATELPATSGGECSRQKKPEYSWGRLSKALGSWGSGNLEGGGFG
jgi:hypothetical protein